jgi:hypothetical protein
MPQFKNLLIDIRAQWKFLGFCFSLQAIVYSFYFFGMVYTDHTLKMAMVQDYPSYRTTVEGRWLQDLVIFGLGSTGAHRFQMILAAAFQSLNALLLLRIAGLREGPPIFLCGALYCLYPAFLDYFGFGIDHVGFVLGDTLVLLGALSYIELRGSWQRVVLPGLFYTCGLAVYQPKIALVCLMASVALLARWSFRDSAQNLKIASHCFTDILLAFFSVGAALGLYRLSVAMVIAQDSRGFTKLNGPSQILSAVAESFRVFYQHFIGAMGGLPGWLFFLPLLALCIGGFCLSRNLWIKSKHLMFISIAVFAMIPLGLGASEILKSNSDLSHGRFVSANGICLVYFLAQAFQCPTSKPVACTIAAILVYFYGILGIQQNTAAEFKAEWEWNFQNRIAARLELLASVQSAMPLVVIGEVHYPHHKKMIKYEPLHAKSQVFWRSFASYSQVQQMNFLLGREAFRKPSPQEVAKALNSAKERPLWPNPGGAYIADGIIVLVLGSPYPGVSTTK